MRTPSLQVRTPEGIVFSQELAGPISRFLAWSIDAVCILLLLTAMSYVLTVVRFVSLGLATALSILGYFVISIGYGIASEWLWRGQTVGKRILRLRVVDAEGLRLQFNQIVTRNLLRAVDSLPLLYLVGGSAAWLSSRCQRLGDVAANTIVIRNPEFSEPPLEQISLGKFNSLRQHPHLAARLRQVVTPGEASILLRSVLRRDQLEDEARLALFGELARDLRSKVVFPQEATDGLSDEQYVRNVLEIVYS